jgi:hypothetical protein
MLGLVGLGSLAQGAEPLRPRLAVLIVFDQMRADYLTRWETLFEKGGLGRLVKDGAWFQNCHYPYANTFTAAGHASLATGCSPDKHGIVGNEWYDRAAGKEITAVESDRYQPVPAPDKRGKKRISGSAPDRLLAPTLGDALKKATEGKGRVFSLSLKTRSAIMLAGKKADGVYWFSTYTGSFLTSTFYREKLHRWVAEYNGARPADTWFGRDWTRLRSDLDYVRYSGPDNVAGEWTGYKQGRTFPHPMTGGLKQVGRDYYEAVVNSPFGNDLLLGLAKKAIAAEGLGKNDTPDLLCISFSSNDIVGHCYGPDSQEVLDVTLRSDRLMKDLLQYLDAEVGRDRYVLAVSADHGVCPLPEVVRARGKDAGRISPDTVDAKANQFLNAKYNAGGKPVNFVEAAVYPWVYLNPATLKAFHLEPAAVEEALALWLARQPGIQAAYTRTQLAKGPFKANPVAERVRRSCYAGRSGDVTIVLKPHYLLTNRLMGTTHGAPHAYDTHVPLLINGAGVRAQVRKDAITPQAAAVILAHALGIKPPARAEIPLPEGLLPAAKRD